MKILNCFALIACLAVCAAELPKEAGIGVLLGVEGQHIVIRGILPDSPVAVQTDVRVGDRIIAVAQDQEPAVQVQGGKLEQVVPLIRGPQGSTVRLTILPAGEDESRVRVVSFVRGDLKGLALWGDGILLAKGMKAPDIEMIGLADGGSERLSDHAGKIIVLEFWATWCAPCQKTMADLQSYSDRYPEWKDKVVLVAASLDDNKETAARHLKTRGWDQTHNVWIQNDAIKAYHVDRIPTQYVIDRKGKILAANPVDISIVVHQELGAQ